MSAARSAFLDRLAAAVRQLGRSQERVLVAVDGPDAAGKTSLADELGPRLAGAGRLCVDDHLAPDAVRYARGRLSAEGCYRDAVDLPRLRAHLDAVPSGVLVVDGVFLHRPELRPLWDLSVYLHVPEEEVLRRAVVRDAARIGSAAEVERRYRARYLPAQELYRREADPLAAATVVVDGTDPAAPVVLRWG